MSEFDKLLDEELINNGISFKSEEMSVIITRYKKLVFYTAKQFLGYNDYDELVSEGFLGLLDAVRCFDSTKGKFSSLAKVCVSNRMKNVVSATAREDKHIEDKFDMIEIVDKNAGPEEHIIQQEYSVELNQQIRKRLSLLERQVFLLYLNEYSYEMIAKKLNIEEKTVDNALYRAKQKMKSYFI